MLDKLTRETFAAHLNEPFRIHYGGAEPLPTTLVSVTPLGAAPPEGSSWRQPFALLLRGPQGGYLPQKIYPVEHDALGTLEIFLVPIGPDEEGMRYEVIFT